MIATAFLGVGDAIGVVGTSTQTIKVTGSYYFIQVFLLLWLVLTLLSVIKHAKEHGDKTRIVNVVDEDAIREVHNKQSLKGLFEEENQAHHEEAHHAHHHVERNEDDE